MSQRLRIIVILGKVNSSGDVCVNGDNTGSSEGMGTWRLVSTFWGQLVLFKSEMAGALNIVG